MFSVLDVERPAFSVPSVIDALVAPDESAAALASALPCGDSVAALAVLEPGSLSAAGRVDALVAADRAIAWLTGLQQQLLVELADEGAATQQAHQGAAPPSKRRHVGEPSGQWWAAEQLACACRSPRSPPRKGSPPPRR